MLAAAGGGASILCDPRCTFVYVCARACVCVWCWQAESRAHFLQIAHERSFFRPLLKAALEPIVFKGFPDRADVNNMVQELSERRIECCAAQGVHYPMLADAVAPVDASSSVLHSWSHIPTEEQYRALRLDSLRVRTQWIRARAGMCVCPPLRRLTQRAVFHPRRRLWSSGQVTRSATRVLRCAGTHWCCCLP